MMLLELVILIITAVTLPGWFALGAYFTVLLQIILPIRRTRRLALDTRELIAVAAQLRAAGETYTQISKYTVLPKNTIPSTLRKSWY